MKENITETIKYIGVYDKDVDIFESQYKVPNGMAYNSYIIMDEKIAIFDTIDEKQTEKWIQNIESCLGDREPDYLIISHLEPDHAANIQLLAKKYKNLKLVGNAKTFAMLPQFFDFEFTDRKVIVDEGDSLSLGSHTLSFYLAAMVHWPEVMVAYEHSEKILFSADAFGRFGSNDENDDWVDEARRYYFNIVGKYGAQVISLLEKAATLDISKICPLHGSVLDKDLGKYIDLYKLWGNYEPEKSGVFIAYASIYGHTADIAKKLYSKLLEKGIQADICDLAREDVSAALSKAFAYDRLVIASSSYDGGIFPPAEAFLSRLKSKMFKNRKVGIIENGSWGPTAGKVIKSYMEPLKNITILEPVVTVKTSLSEQSSESLEKLFEALQ